MVGCVPKRYVWNVQWVLLCHVMPFERVTDGWECVSIVANCYVVLLAYFSGLLQG